MIHCVIVAGGQSSRMRQSAPPLTPPKPHLEILEGSLAGTTLLENTLSCARTFMDADDHCIVVGPPMDLPPWVEITRESPPMSGPASAISAGLAALPPAKPHTDEYVFILAADVIDPEPAMEALLRASQKPQSPETQGWIALADGHREPLLCLLSLDPAQSVFRDVHGGSVRKVLANLRLEDVPIDDSTDHNANSSAGHDAKTSPSHDVDTWDEATAHGIGLTSGPATWRSARARVAAAARAIYTEHLERPVSAAPRPGLIPIHAVTSPIDVPHYTSSAMDGYAICHHESRSSSPADDTAATTPAEWILIADHVSGAQRRNVHKSTRTVRPGEAAAVLTGSLLPEGTTAIVRSEHAEVADGVLRIKGGVPPRPGADIRHAGEELPAGEVLVPAGHELNARQVALVNACGVDTIDALPDLTVECAFSGYEVITAGLPQPGEVRDAFSTSFPHLIEECGARVVSARRLSDDPDEVGRWLDAATADILIVTGGSGHSSQDFARALITERARQIVVDSVRCAPGHPTLVAAREHPHKDGATQLIFGVPGNPLAAHTALHSFIAPAIAVARGKEFPATRTCIASEDYPADKRPRTRLVPAALRRFGSEGTAVTTADATATPMTRTHSHMLSGYANADVLLVVPQEGLAAGDQVSYLPLP